MTKSLGNILPEWTCRKGLRSLITLAKASDVRAKCRFQSSLMKWTRDTADESPDRIIDAVLRRKRCR